MAIITEIQFAHEDGALAETLGTFPDIQVTVIRETSTDPEQSMYFLRFDCDDPGELRDVLERDRSVAEVRRVPELDGEYLWGVEFTGETKLLGPRVTSEGGFVVDARSAAANTDRRGWHERWLLPDREAIHNIWTYAREEGFDFEVLELRQSGGARTTQTAPEALTPEQRDALDAAYRQGYFTEPRETSLEEIAETLDLSPSALGGRLKRGMKSLIGNTLVVEEREE